MGIGTLTAKVQSVGSGTLKALRNWCYNNAGMFVLNMLQYIASGLDSSSITDLSYSKLKTELLKNLHDFVM